MSVYTRSVFDLMCLPFVHTTMSVSDLSRITFPGIARVRRRRGWDESGGAQNPAFEVAAPVYAFCAFAMRRGVLIYGRVVPDICLKWIA